MTNAEFLAVPVPHRLIRLGAHTLVLRIEVGCLTKAGRPIYARKWLDPLGAPKRMTIEQTEGLWVQIAECKAALLAEAAAMEAST